jgi:hypothetical protein
VKNLGRLVLEHRDVVAVVFHNVLDHGHVLFDPPQSCINAIQSTITSIEARIHGIESCVHSVKTSICSVKSRLNPHLHKFIKTPHKYIVYQVSKIIHFFCCDCHVAPLLQLVYQSYAIYYTEQRPYTQ